MKIASALIATLILTNFAAFFHIYNQSTSQGNQYLETISTTNAPSAIGPYSQGKILVQQNMIFASGQIALDPKTGIIVGTDVQTQTTQVLKNIKAIIEAGGSSMEYVFKATVYLTNMDDFPLMNKVYEQYFQEGLPARSCVQISKLPNPDAKVEIEVMAVIPK